MVHLLIWVSRTIAVVEVERTTQPTAAVVLLILCFRALKTLLISPFYITFISHQVFICSTLDSPSLLVVSFTTELVIK